MFVGVLKVALTIVGARSLKEKRRVVSSFKERVIGRFKVSAAEIASLDDPRHAVMGVAVVSNDAAHCDSVLAEVARVASTLPDALLSDRASGIVPFGEAGRSLQRGFEALHDPGALADHEEKER